MIEFLKSFLFGIVEGITEWLPISSTGHLILLNQFVKLNVSEEFYSMFEVVIQLGAILAVVILFWNQIFPFGAPEGSHTVRRRQAKHAHRKKKSGNGILSYVKMDIIILWLKVLVACIPAIVIGMPFNDLFEKWFYNYPCVAIALIVFGIAFIIVENNHKGKPAKINSMCAVFAESEIVGLLAQDIAPGDIVLGCVESICQRTAAFAQKLAPANPKVFFSGGLAQFDVIKQSLANHLGVKEVATDSLCQYTGAIGAAVLGIRKIKR